MHDLNTIVCESQFSTMFVASRNCGELALKIYSTNSTDVKQMFLMTVLGEHRTSSAAGETNNVLRLQSLANGAPKLFLVLEGVCIL